MSMTPSKSVQVYEDDDTAPALCVSDGTGGVAVVRLTRDECETIARELLHIAGRGYALLSNHERLLNGLP